MRVVIDTNILVSGLLAADGPPGRVVAAIAEGRLRPLLCDAILAEYRAVLPRPRLRIRPDRVAQLLALLAQTSDWVAVPPYPGTPALPDAADWPFIAAAPACDCPLITGNLEHFPARLGVGVMTARGWVDVGNDQPQSQSSASNRPRPK